MNINKAYVRGWKARPHSTSPYHNEWWFYDTDWELVWWLVEWKKMMKIEKTCLWLINWNCNLLIWEYDWFHKLNDMRDIFYDKLKNSTSAYKWFIWWHTKFSS